MLFRDGPRLWILVAISLNHNAYGGKRTWHGLKGKARDRNQGGTFSSVRISDESGQVPGSSQIKRDEQEGAN